MLVETIFHSDEVNVVNEQHGDRVELRSTSSRPGTNLVEYTVLVPAAAFVTLRSSDGTLRAQGLRGDVVLDAASGSVEVTDISDAHLHVKTLDGPITLTDIRNSHLDIHSVRGSVNLHNVTGPSVEVNSGAGRITYEGDPGRVGDYMLTSHTGDFEVSNPGQCLGRDQGALHKKSARPRISEHRQHTGAWPDESAGKAGKDAWVPL